MAHPNLASNAGDAALGRAAGVDHVVALRAGTVSQHPAILIAESFHSVHAVSEHISLPLVVPGIARHSLSFYGDVLGPSVFGPRDRTGHSTDTICIHPLARLSDESVGVGADIGRRVCRMECLPPVPSIV